MPAYLTLPGQPALSSFRLARLLERLRQIDPRVAGVDANHVHFVWAEATLTGDQQARLQALLEAPADPDLPPGPAQRGGAFGGSESAIRHLPSDPSQTAGRQSQEAAAKTDPRTPTLWVVPRIGTVSPWASKATDIVHNCGMSHIHRIERGIVYTLHARGGLLAGLVGKRDFDQAALAQVGALLHDRMTETLLLSAPDPALIFQSLPGKPMQRIAVGANGRTALEA
ncbi:MAG TPA: hypothetical protein PK177_22220, partial [Burkholderiaceae bacterium]|nr:hypothetical protein [Burkholderiaceae bacterium]